MCDSAKAKILIAKLECILAMVRNQNSGADAHFVGNIRNACSMLIQQLSDDPGSFEDEIAEQILKNQQDKLIEFYRNKYFKH